jgi:hypothetical protein
MGVLGNESYLIRVAFEAFLKQDEGARPRRSWRSITLACSLMLHGAGAAAATAHSFWHVEELQPPVVRVTLSMRMPTAPPPPPAPVERAPEAPKPVKQPPQVAARKPRPVAVLAPAITQPAPAAAAPAEAAPGPEDRAGVVTGPADATGGVPGGSPAVAAPPPPPKPVEQPPVMLPPNVGVGQRITDVNDPRFRPSLPRAMKIAGASAWGLYRICVGPDGTVKDVKVLKSADALVDPEWIAVVKRWTYRPYQLNGRAVPFCHPARIEVQTAP